MNAPEWEKARYDSYHDLYWEQTEEGLFSFDFDPLARQLDERIPPSLLTEMAKGRNPNIPNDWPCPFCSKVFTRKDNRRVHLRDSCSFFEEEA